MQSELLSVKDLKVKLSKKLILDQISFDLFPKQIVTLIGPNGAGKSTLVRAILGLIPLSKGSIHKRADLTIGYMPQKILISHLMPLSVLDFLKLSQPRFQKVDLQNLLSRLEIKHLAQAEIQHISGGEFQRVLLGRALLQKPDLLILDEPVQGVDVTGQSALYELFSAIRDEDHCGILMVSHDLHFVMAGTDHVMCLNQHICCSGDPKAVRQNPAFINLFGQQASSHLAIYAHHHNHQHTLDGQIQTKQDKEA